MLLKPIDCKLPVFHSLRLDGIEMHVGMDNSIDRFMSHVDAMLL